MTESDRTGEDDKKLVDLLMGEGKPTPKENVMTVMDEESSIDDIIGAPRREVLIQKPRRSGINMAAIAATLAASGPSVPYDLDAPAEIRVPGRRNWARVRDTKRKRDSEKEKRRRKMAKRSRRGNR
jgi:hypothetical protein